MARILFGVDNAVFDPAILDFPSSLTKPSETEIIGLFIVRENEGKELREKNVQLFKEACTHRGLLPRVVYKKGRLSDQIVGESRYVDVILINPRMPLCSVEEMKPETFLLQIIARSECPVLVIPFNFNDVTELSMIYDGSHPSVFAIKQFAQLFPQFTHKKITIIHLRRRIKKSKSNKNQLLDWVRMYYTNVHYHEEWKHDLKSILANENSNKGTITIVGTYGKSLTSRILKIGSRNRSSGLLSMSMFVANTYSQA